MKTLHELWLFLRARRAWWLAPIVVVLLLLGLVLLSQSALSPLLYTLF